MNPAEVTSRLMATADRADADWLPGTAEVVRMWAEVGSVRQLEPARAAAALRREAAHLAGLNRRWERSGGPVGLMAEVARRAGRQRGIFEEAASVLEAASLAPGYRGP